MRSKFYGLGLAAFAASLLGSRLTPLPQSEPAPRRPDPPRARDPFDPSTRSQSRRKREREERATLKAGTPGAGLWRKCRAGGRVRGY